MLSYAAPTLSCCLIEIFGDGGELNEIQIEENRLLSSSRVVCENAFAGVKRYGAVSQIYRNRVNNFDDSLMLTAAGLWNLYLVAA